MIEGVSSIKIVFSSKALTANPLRELLPAVDDEFYSSPELTPEQQVKFGEEIKTQFRQEQSVEDIFRKVRAAGQEISRAFERGDDEAIIDQLKSNRELLEKQAAAFQLFADALLSGEPFEIKINYFSEENTPSGN